jgi:hypothetical protein
MNDGHGRFTFFETLPPTIGPPDNAFVYDIKVADVNGDGSPDLIFAETLNDPFYQTSRIQILINDGQGHFSDETATRMPRQPQTTDYPAGILVDDVNDDGRPDLTVHFIGDGGRTMTQTAVYLNQNGSFHQIKAPGDGFDANGGAIAYVNGDGPHALFSVDFRPIADHQASNYFVTPQIVPPAAPRHVRAILVPGGIRVTWTPVAQASRYQVRRNGTLMATTSSATFFDRHPARGAGYTVRSVNAAGTSVDTRTVHP